VQSFWISCGIPRLCWIRVERVDTLVLFLTLEGLFSFFPHLVSFD
jgi:hypothetical protein